MSHTIPSLWAATARPPLDLPAPEGEMAIVKHDPKLPTMY